MSDIFIKSDINDLISSVQSENLELPQWLNIVDNNSGSETSENNLTNINDNKNILSETSINNALDNDVTSSVIPSNDINTDMLSATSDNIFTNNNNDIFIGQNGGNHEQSISSPEDINNLIAMLTSEKKTHNNVVDNNEGNVENNDFDTVTSITNTSALEDQLRELLSQAGGAKKKSSPD